MNDMQSDVGTLDNLMADADDVTARDSMEKSESAISGVAITMQCVVQVWR